MKNQILRLRAWFEQLSLRERLLFALLIWAVTYALFSLVLFRPLNNQRTAYLDQIKITKNQLSSLQLQTEAIDKIANSPLYLEWKQQNLTYEKMQDQYKTLISNFSESNWHDIIKTIIASHPNITLSHIDNSDEKPFAPEASPTKGHVIYQQNLTLIIYGDYFNIIKYLQHLEKALPNVHWETLNYEVVTYPMAKITIGFSVFYGKKIKS